MAMRCSLETKLFGTTVLALAIAGCGGGAGSEEELATSADAVTVGGWNIDGSVPDAGATNKTDPSGSTKELGPLNSNTTKVGVIHMDAVPTLDLTNPNGQVDLKQVWYGTKTDPSTNHIWFYAALERESNTGSGVNAWEFQQAAAPTPCDYANKTNTQLIADCNPWANRQPGDFMIVFDQQGNSADVILRTFTDPDGGTWSFGQPLALDAGVHLTSSTSAAQFSTDGLKFEAAVDLTATVFKPNTCNSIATVIPNTITGNSDTADYKDTVLGIGTDIGNCGSLRVIKNVSPSTASGTFTYAVDRPGTSLIQYPSTQSLSGSLTRPGTTSADYTDDYTNVIAGADYTIAETPPSGWTLTSIVCAVNGGAGVDVTAGGAFQVVANKQTICTITNTQQLGAIEVTKEGLNKALGLGNWPISGASFAIKNAAGTTVATCGPTGLDGKCCVDQLAFATYSVVETTAPTGYLFDATSPPTKTGVVVNASSDCTAAPANAPVAVTLENTPLSKLVFERKATFTSKAGTGVTQAHITCDDTPNPDVPLTGLDNNVAWTNTRTFDNISTYPSTYTFNCTVTVDP